MIWFNRSGITINETLFDFGFLTALIVAETAWLKLLWEGVKYAF